MAKYKFLHNNIFIYPYNCLVDGRRIFKYKKGYVVSSKSSIFGNDLVITRNKKIESLPLNVTYYTQLFYHDYKNFYFKSLRHAIKVIKEINRTSDSNIKQNS